MSQNILKKYSPGSFQLLRAMILEFYLRSNFKRASQLASGPEM